MANTVIETRHLRVKSIQGNMVLLAMPCQITLPGLLLSESEASPTLGCSIEISCDICVCVSVVFRMSKCVGGKSVLGGYRCICSMWRMLLPSGKLIGLFYLLFLLSF